MNIVAGCSGDMDLRNSPNRRQVLKSLGASASVPLLTQTVSAARTNRELFMKAKDAFRNHKPNEARELFEKAGVDHQIQANYVSEDASLNTSGSDGSGSITTQSYFEKNKSAVYFAGASVIDNPDQSLLMLDWNLKGGDNGINNPHPQDVAVLAWDGSQYGSVSGSTRYDATAYRPSGKKSVSMELDSPPLIGDGSPNAVAVTLDDHTDFVYRRIVELPKRIEGYLETKVFKQDPQKGRLAGQYTHTWNFSGLYNMLETVSASYKGAGVSIALPSGVSGWDVYDSVTI
jgi:hypothetical protein